MNRARHWLAGLGGRALGGAVLVMGARLLALGQAPAQDATALTFNRDIAPLVFARCSRCHRPGDVGPFDLLTYDDVRRRARQIVEVTRTRFMPPWLPASGFGAFEGERRLTDDEIARFRRWFEQGTIEGEPADRLNPPSWPDGWSLGEPDLIVRMPEAYTLQADGPDVFRNFAIALPVDGTRFVRGVEFHPENPRIVHHAIMRVDRARTPGRRPDGRDGSDTESMTLTEGQSPDGQFIGWAPGKVPSLGPADLAWRLEPGTDLILELHMLPSGKPEAIQSEIGFYFSAQPPARVPFGLQLGSYAIDIPPGAASYAIADSYTLPVDVEVHSIYPHAHYLGKRVVAYATLPDGRREWLINIPDWDFNWQDQYRYAEPVVLPRGTTLTMEITYDNSSANVQNRHDPPQRVRYGGRSADEMGNLWLQLVLRDPDDLPVLQRDVERDQTRRYIAGDELWLQYEPESPTVHASLAASYLKVGRVNGALVHLREALRLGLDDAYVRYNLGTALAAKGDFVESIRHYREAVRLDPDYAEAHNNLGVALQAQGLSSEAAEQYRLAVTIQDDYPEAHNNLGVVLRAEGRLDDAIGHFQRAVELRPSYGVARANLTATIDARNQAAPVP